MGKETKSTPAVEATAGVTTETTGVNKVDSKANPPQIDVVANLRELLSRETDRANEAESRADLAEAQLEDLKVKYQDAEAEKVLYEAADGKTYEFTQPDFRYRGTHYFSEEVLTDHELLEELIDAKSFILKPVV